MKKITKKELKTILEQHELWLGSNKKEGKCANLTGVNLSGAHLIGVDLSGANLTDTDLSGANLTSADLTGTDLRFADLYRTDLTSADLSGANLTSADLTRANLTRANLTSADLTRVNLRYAYLTDTILDEKEQCRKGIVLTEPMTGYKKSNEGKIITLKIPIGAKVFSISNDKRRANKAKVIDSQGETELSSMYNTNFKYHVGDEIEITDFDERYNVECAEGVHFFLTRKEAKKYNF